MTICLLLTHRGICYDYDSNTQKIYAINTFDGTCNLFEGNSDFSEYEQITHLEDGTQMFSISIMDSILLYDAVENHERNIAYSINYCFIN